MLGISTDFLYRSDDAKSFRVRVGSRVLISHQKAQALIARTAPISLQDLLRRLHVMAKAEKDRRGSAGLRLDEVE